MSKENTIDYLENIQIHKFPEDMSIYECALETCLFAESNWAYIIESTMEDEYNTYESCIVNGAIKEEAFNEANSDESKETFFNKCIESLKKIGAFIAGLFSKFIVEMGKLFTNNKFLLSAEAEKRMENGLSKLGDLSNDKKSFYGIILDSNGFNSLIERLKDVNGTIKDIGSVSISSRSAKDELESKYSIKSIYKTIIGKEINDTDKEFKKNIYDLLVLDKGTSVDSNGVAKDDKKYTFDNTVYKSCLENFKESKNYKSKAKEMYGITKLSINTSIAQINSLKNKEIANADKKLDEAIMSDNTKMYVKRIHDISKILAKTNGMVLTIIKQDYMTCCKVLLKLYNLGKSASSSEKDSQVEVNASAVFEQESIESIFGSPAYI